MVFMNCPLLAILERLPRPENNLVHFVNVLATCVNWIVTVFAF